MARPSVDPDWAETLAADPVSGQNNRVEPPASWKADGWSYQEKPPRNYDNFVKWNTGQWIKYLDQVGARPATYFVAASDSGTETQYHADAVCDGTDDHVELNAAIAAVDSAPGAGKVLLSEGTFTVSASVLLSAVNGIHLQGMGQGATVIKVVDADTGTYDIVSVLNSAYVTVSELTINGNSTSVTSKSVGIKITNSSNVAVQNVAVDAVSRNVTGGEGIHVVSGTGIKILGCWISDCQWHGLFVEGGAPTIDACTIGSCGYNGAELASDYTSMTGCQVYSSTGNGILLTADHCVVNGCRSFSNTLTGISFLNSSYCVVTGCQIIENGADGIFFDTSAYNIATGNIVLNNGQTIPNTYDGIAIDAGSNSNLVQGNTCRSATDQRYGISCLSATNYVVGNYLLGGGVSGALNGTVKTSWGSNQIWDGVSAHTAITGAMVNVTA